MTQPAWSARMRREPELAHGRFALAHSAGTRGRVIACSAGAFAQGVRVDMSVHHALARCPELAVKTENLADREAAREALYDAAASLSPGIEPDGDQVFLDARGVRARWQSEEGFAAALHRQCERVGLAVHVAIASGRRIAQALATADNIVCPVGDEAARLGPQPIETLGLHTRLIESLKSLGIHRASELASLDPAALNARLGPDATRAVHLARGEDDTPVLCIPRGRNVREKRSLDWEISTVEPLLFVCKSLLDAGLSRLLCRALAAQHAEVTLFLRGGAVHTRKLSLTATSRESSVWLRLLRTSLEAAPPTEAVTDVQIELDGCPFRSTQLALFERPGPAPEQRAVALSRIEALVGTERMGTVEEPPSHHPHALALARWNDDQVRNDSNTLSDPNQHETIVGAHLAMHTFRPPRDVRVRVRTGAVVSLDAGAIYGRVLRSAGPYRSAGAWWCTDTAFEVDSYDVELEDHTLYRVNYDRRLKRWRLEGRYE
ncbi:MAG: DNA polymerase Y family protein [Deltaproteobacteria bacterium]|nr:DNA polymerase Y family protein [Deltaproteobacteria bacterium]